MSGRDLDMTNAIDAIDRSFSHHTAHLDAADQCAVAVMSIRSMVETIQDVSRESALEGMKHKDERIAKLEAELAQANSDRRLEHGRRVLLAGELEAMTERKQRAESQAEQMLTRIRDLEAELAEARGPGRLRNVALVDGLKARIRDLDAELADARAWQMSLIYYVSGHVTSGAIRTARQSWIDLQSKVGRLEAAANEVLKAYMPKFPNSLAVDDCLVGLAAAVAGEKTETKTDHAAQCKGCRHSWSSRETPYEGTHCYMFKDAPTGPCAQRKPE